MTIIRRASRNESFTIVNNEPIVDPRIKMDELGILTYLLSKPDDWVVNRKHLINLDRGCGDYVLRRAFKNLEDCGYFRRVQKRYDDGTFYWEIIVYDSPFAWKTAGRTTRGLPTSGSPTSGSPTRGKPRPLVMTERPMTEVVKTDVPTTRDQQLFELDQEPSGSDDIREDAAKYTDDFESFWSIYPRRLNKRKAFGCWNARLREKVPVETMLAAARNYAAEVKRNQTEAKFVKHPATFLSKNRPFEDYEKKMIDVKSRTHNFDDEHRLDESATGEVSLSDMLGFADE